MNERQMSRPDYYPQLDSMNNNQKGAYFLAILKAKLLLSGFIVAVPEPDIGDDLWIATPSLTPGQIYPAQVKSIYAYQQGPASGIRKYMTNVKLPNLEKSISAFFLYFIGLYDETNMPDRFHMACIPSTFFQNNWTSVQRSVVKNPYKDRVHLDFYYNIQEKQYLLFPKFHVDVTDFFGNFDAIK
jgi:hypothetical protein